MPQRYWQFSIVLKINHSIQTHRLLPLFNQLVMKKKGKRLGRIITES